MANGKLAACPTGKRKSTLHTRPLSEPGLACRAATWLRRDRREHAVRDETRLILRSRAPRVGNHEIKRASVPLGKAGPTQSEDEGVGRTFLRCTPKKGSIRRRVAKCGKPLFSVFWPARKFNSGALFWGAPKKSPFLAPQKSQKSREEGRGFGDGGRGWKEGRTFGPRGGGRRCGVIPPSRAPRPSPPGCGQKKGRKLLVKSGSLRQRGAAGSRTQDGGFAIRCLSLLATAPFRPNPTAGRKFGSSVWDAVPGRPVGRPAVGNRVFSKDRSAFRPVRLNQLFRRSCRVCSARRLPLRGRWHRGPCPARIGSFVLEARGLRLGAS